MKHHTTRVFINHFVTLKTKDFNQPVFSTKFQLQVVLTDWLTCSCIEYDGIKLTNTHIKAKLHIVFRKGKGQHNLQILNTQQHNLIEYSNRITKVI